MLRKLKPKYICTIILLILILSINNILSFGLEVYCEKRLEKKELGIEGDIGSISLNIFTGSYSFVDVSIKKKGQHEDSIFFLELGKIKGDIVYQKLIQGILSMDMEVVDLKLIIDKIANGKDKELKSEKTIMSKIKGLIPIELTQLKAKNLDVTFKNHSSKSNLFIRNLKLIHLFQPDRFEDKLSPFNFDGVFNNLAEINLSGGINLLIPEYPLDIKLHASQFDLDNLNKLLINHVPLDFTSAEIQIFSEFSGNLNKGEGYFRFYLDDLDVVERDQEFKSPEHIMNEFLGGFINWVVEVSVNGDIRTEIPFRLTTNGLGFYDNGFLWASLENFDENLNLGFKK